MHLLFDWAKIADAYGTWEKGLILYSLAKMHRAESVIEIGTGHAVSTFCLAAALKANGSGRVLTIDDGSQWKHSLPSGTFAKTIKAHPLFGKALDSALARKKMKGRQRLDYFVLLKALRKVLGLDGYVEFLKAHVDLMANDDLLPDTHPRLASAFKRPVDLVFCDYRSGIASTLRMLRCLLPRMSASSSILFDAESTWHPSFLAIERTVSQLNSGKIPAAFLAGASKRLKNTFAQIVATRHFQVVHFVEKNDNTQNSLMWIKIEPVNVFPYPLSQTRGMPEGKVTRAHLVDFFEP
jgi:hypothetical protein